ncbi:MAG: RNA 3'-terminal phosphate cyclase [Nitrososphaeria archaeon]|nr:RNA 3'-terminal phosphate cyclase [Nitrososphaeria archaeon]
MPGGFVEIDGSVGEGGGQILRNAVALSAVLLKPIRVYNIRAKRSKPGLRPQHLVGVKAVAALSSAEVTGLEVGSMEITFKPKHLGGGRLSFDAGTAGSTTLMLQSLMPAMAFSSSPIEVELRGGTNNPMAPPVEYFKMVLLPMLSRMGCRFEIELLRRGFYPRGGGIVKAKSTPVNSLKPIKLTEAGDVKRVHVLSYSCRLPAHIAERMAATAERHLRERGYDTVVEKQILQPGDKACSIDPGCGIILVAEMSSGALMGSDNLGRLGVPAENVAEEATKSLLKQIDSGAAVDRHLGDQLVIWASLADGISEYRVSELTMHTVTSIELCKLLSGAKAEISGKLGGPATVRMLGIGLRR